MYTATNAQERQALMNYTKDMFTSKKIHKKIFVVSGTACSLIYLKSMSMTCLDKFLFIVSKISL